MTDASGTVEPQTRTGFAEIAALVLLAAIPLVYFPGLTFHYTYLKLPLFQIVAILNCHNLAADLFALRNIDLHFCRYGATPIMS